MQIRFLIALLTITLLGVAGCNGKKPAGCAKDASCPAGHVCLSRKCEQLCNYDAECVAGNHCNGEICVTGARQGGPVIDSIDGKGDGIDPESCRDFTFNACLGTAIVLAGANLGGSEFRLISESSAGPRYNLGTPTGGRLQDDLVDLAPVPSETIEEGKYKLVAVNSVGTAQVSIELLKGDPGSDANMTGSEIIVRLNNFATTGVIDADHVAPMAGTDIVAQINDVATVGLIASNRIAGGGGGGSASVYLYDNSTTATSSTHSGDRMVVRLPASATQVAQLAIDQARLIDLCGDADGCSLSLGVTGWVDGPYTYDKPFIGDTCRVFLDGTTGDWSVSSDCAQWYATWTAGSSNPPAPTDMNGFFTAYYAWPVGTDGDVPEVGHFVIHNRACYFADAPPLTSSTTAEFAADTATGFYLVASHPTWGGNKYPQDAGGDTTAFWDIANAQRNCELHVAD